MKPGKRFGLSAEQPANYAGDTVNALPDTDDVFFRSPLRLAKCESFAYPQPHHSRNRNDRAQKFWCIGDELPHFIVSEATRFFLYSLARQGQVRETEVTTCIEKLTKCSVISVTQGRLNVVITTREIDTGLR